MKKLSYYKTIAGLYDTIVPRDIKGISDSVEKVIQRYNNKMEILDLGCGTGRFTIELAKRGYIMTGLDITNEMLEVARRTAKMAKVKVKFIRGDMRNFQLKKNIGVMWARGSIGDLFNLTDVERAFKNIRNNLLKKGIFIFDVRNYSDFLKTYKNGYHQETRILKTTNKVCKFSFTVKLDKKSRRANIEGLLTVKDRKSSKTHKVNHIMRAFTKKQIVTLLSDTGFKILETLPGYKFEESMKPGTRIVVIAQK